MILADFFKAVFGIWTEEAKERRRRRREARERKKEAERRKRIDIEKVALLAEREKTRKLKQKLKNLEQAEELKRRKEKHAEYWKATYKPKEIDPNPYEEDDLN